MQRRVINRLVAFREEFDARLQLFFHEHRPPARIGASNSIFNPSFARERLIEIFELIRRPLLVWEDIVHIVQQSIMRDVLLELLLFRIAI